MNNKPKFSLALKIFIGEIVVLGFFGITRPAISDGLSILLGFWVIKLGILVIVILLAREFWNNKQHS